MIENFTTQNFSFVVAISEDWTAKLIEQINSAVENYTPCEKKKCSCHSSVIENDLQPFSDGITKEQFAIARAKGTKYQVRLGC